MTEKSRLDLRALLERVEAAAPVDAVTVVAAELSAMTGARAVSFLISDFSGHSLVRLGTVTASGAEGRSLGLESAQTVPLEGTVYGDVLRTQRVDVRAAADGRSVLSPAVASRLMTRVRTPAAPADTPLSAREREVLVLVARGTTNREIAAELFISEATVKTHLTHIFAKLGTKDRAAAVAVGYDRGILG